MKRLVCLAAFSGALLISGSFAVQAQEKAENDGKSGEMAEPSATWKWANFVLLAAGLGYLLAKTMPPLFKSRTEEIQKGIAEAQKIKQEADQRAAEVEARLKTLGHEIEQFRTQSKAEMQREGERIRQETAAQIGKQEQQASQEIEAASKAAQRELKLHASTLALQLAEERLRGQVGSSDGLVDGFIHDLGASIPGGELRN